MKILYKQIINITSLLIVVGVLFLPAFSFVEAKFKNTRSSLKIDGVVVDVGINTLTVSTPGSLDITVDVNERTRFSKVDSLNDLSKGDQVYIKAKIREGQNPLAKRIKKWGDEGYGYGYGGTIIYGTIGDRVKIKEGKVIGKKGNTFTILTNVTEITFTVNEDTKFKFKEKFKEDFDDLAINDIVKVKGRDNGTEFVATRVKIRN